MKRLLMLLSLFASTGTLVCCAIPALLVMLGFGATLAGFIGAFPQVVVLSEHKGAVFGAAAALLTIAWIMTMRNAQLSCPVDGSSAEACRSARGVSRIMLWISSVLFVIGAAVTFVAPIFLRESR